MSLCEAALTRLPPLTPYSPPWKLFATTWWGHPEHSVLTDHGRWFVPAAEAAKGRWSWNPLGSEWTLSPYAMPENVSYLSVLRPCPAPRGVRRILTS